jgi:hypothetical protein
MKKLNDLINNLETYKELTTVPRDTLIKELKECKDELTEQLRLHSVSQHRELLLGFQKSEYFDLYEQGVLEYKDAIEKYLA